MGVDVGLVWQIVNRQGTPAEVATPESRRAAGSLRESYHEAPQAVRFLVRGAIEAALVNSGTAIVRIPAAILRQRCDDAVALAVHCDRDDGRVGQELSRETPLGGLYQQDLDEAHLEEARASLKANRELGVPLPVEARAIEDFVAFAEELEACEFTPWVMVSI